MHSSNEIKFEWDENKNSANFFKHGIKFEEATEAFEDPYCRIILDMLHSVGEERYVAIGLTLSHQMLVIIHCYRYNGTTIRIISARKPTKSERAYYYEKRI